MVYSNDENPGEEAVASFGTLLRKSRADAGITMAELARRVNYSKGHVSKIENGLKRPTPMFAKQCDRVLDTGGALAATLPVEGARQTEAAPPADMWVLELEEDGAVRFAEVPRRQLLAGAAALAFTGPARPPRPATDERAVAVLHASFEQYRTLGTMMSPSVVLAPVITLVHTLRTLALDSEEPLRSELLLLAARAAEYVGWLNQESGRDADTLHWTDRAVALAAGRDPSLASFALFRRAEVALYQQDALSTVALARRAQQDTNAGARVLGLAARCEAQGHALAGDVGGCERALERAAVLLATREPTARIVLGSASVPDEIALARGWSLYDLGRPGAAADLLDRHLATIPVAARRARARFGVRRALAHAQHGDIDQACVAAREVLADVAQVDSATVRLDLKDLTRTLQRWHGHRAVVDLYPDLITALHA